MRANFIALDSRVDGGANISEKLLNTFRLLTLVCTTALVSGCLTGLPINRAYERGVREVHRTWARENKSTHANFFGSNPKITSV